MIPVGIVAAVHAKIRAQYFVLQILLSLSTSRMLSIRV